MDDDDHNVMIVSGAHPDLPIIDESGTTNGLYAFLARLQEERAARVAQQNRRATIARDVASVVAPPPSIYAPAPLPRRNADTIAREEALLWLQRTPTGVVAASKFTMPSFIELFRQDYDRLLTEYGRYVPGGIDIPACDKVWTYLPTVVEAIDLAPLLTPPFDDETVDRILEHLRTHMLAKPYYDRYVVLLAAHARGVIPLVARMYYLAKRAQRP